MPPLTNYTFGKDGVNLVKDPLQLGDSEATQLQNAEVVPDEAKGGEGSLSKRGGLGALNGSALAGSVLGAVSLPLQTTFSKLLVAFRGPLTANTMYTSVDGTTWVLSSVPLASATMTQVSNHVTVAAGSRRVIAVRSQLLYPGSDYTVDTSFPPINFWNGGTLSGELLRVPAGPSSDGVAPTCITDMIVANGKAYIAVLESPRSGAPDHRGSVHELNLETGAMKMVAQGFGPTAATMTLGGAPNALCWYQGKLFVGQSANASSAGTDHGKVVSCYPDVDTTWTAEGSVFAGYPVSMCEYNGDLFIGTYTEDVGSSAGVIRRAAATGSYSASYTGQASGEAHVTGLTVFDGNLYAVEYHNSASDILHIKKFDGTSWTTDLDVDSVHSSVITTPAAQKPGGMVVFENALYVAFQPTIVDAAEGFILKRTTGGTWTRVLDTQNLSGVLGVMVTRS